MFMVLFSKCPREYILILKLLIFASNPLFGHSQIIQPWWPAIAPTHGPIPIFLLRFVALGTPDGKEYVANPPTSASSHSVPHSEASGTPGSTSGSSGTVSHFADQGSNPSRHKLLTPQSPTPHPNPSQKRNTKNQTRGTIL